MTATDDLLGASDDWTDVRDRSLGTGGRGMTIPTVAPAASRG